MDQTVNRTLVQRDRQIAVRYAISQVQQLPERLAGLAVDVSVHFERLHDAFRRHRPQQGLAIA